MKTLPRNKDIVADGVLSCFLVLSVLWQMPRMRRPGKVSGQLTSYERVLVLGNGPSLGRDLPKLNPEPDQGIAATNYFAATDFYRTLKPNFYFLQDDYWFEADSTSPKVVETFQSLSQATDWEITLFVPSRFVHSPVIATLEANSFISVEPLEFDRRPQLHASVLPFLGRASEKILVRLWKANLMAFPPLNIVATAIATFLSAGTSQIDVLGLDMTMANDLVVGDDSSLQFLPSHFYGRAANGVAHMSRKGTISENYRAIGLKFRLFELLRVWAEHSSSTILNLSSSTLVDSLRRGKL